MKKIFLVAIVATAFLFAVTPPSQKFGAEVKSISSLSFGPDGILFVGDSKSATVFALNTKDIKQAKKASPIEIKNIDQKIASSLGTQAANITINLPSA